MKRKAPSSTALIAGTARAIVQQTDEQYYQKAKGRLLSLLGNITGHFLEMGAVLAEMRRRSTGLLRKFEQENGILTLEKMHILADRYAVFGTDVPRPGIGYPYFVELASAVRQMREAWPSKPEIIEATYREALDLINEVDPGEIGPRGLAARLTNRFGVISAGEKPFTGIRKPMLDQDEIDQYAATLNPTVEPDFRQWIEAYSDRLRGGSVPWNNQAKHLTCTVRIITHEQTDRITDVIRRALAEHGLNVEYVNVRLHRDD